MSRILICLALLVLLTFPTHSQAGAQNVTRMEPSSLPRDVVIPSLATHETADQFYSIYLPPDYAPDNTSSRRWPVLIMLDPRGRAVEAIRLAVDAARENGWVVLSSYQTRSDVDEQVTLVALQALLTEVQNHVAFDRKRIYLAGMSGTAKTLWTVLPSLHDVVAGMIGCGGGRPAELGRLRLVPPAFFGTAGDRDFNNQEMLELEHALAGTEARHRLDIFNGPHGWPTDDTIGRAIHWLELMAMRDGRTARREDYIDARLASARQRADSAADPLMRSRILKQVADDFESLRDTTALRKEADSVAASDAARAALKQEKRLATAESRFARDFDDWFNRFTHRFEQGRRLPAQSSSSALRELRIAQLRDQAASSDPATAASYARRLERVYVATSFYLPNAMQAMGDEERAVRSLQIATAVFPERATAHWQLAQIYAGQGKAEPALRELRTSQQLGYLDRDSLRTDPVWQPLRDDRRWADLMSSITSE